jgi:hypothetical protein
MSSDPLNNFAGAPPPEGQLPNLDFRPVHTGQGIAIVTVCVALVMAGFFRVYSLVTYAKTVYLEDYKSNNSGSTRSVTMAFAYSMV